MSESPKSPFPRRPALVVPATQIQPPPIPPSPPPFNASAQGASNSAISSFVEAARTIELENRQLKLELVAKTDALRQRESQLADSLKTLQSELARAEAEVRHYQTAWNQYAERDQVLRRILSQDEELKSVREELKLTLSRLGESAARESELRELRDQLAQRQARISELEKSAQSLREDMQAQRALQDTTLKSFKAAVEGQSALDRQKALSDQSSKHDKQVKELESDVQRLRNQIANRDARVCELEALVKTAKEEIRSLQDGTRKSTTELRRELETKHERELRELREHAAEEAKALRRGFELSLQSLSQSHAEQIASVRADQSQSASRERENRDSELMRLRSRYEQADRELQKLREELAEAARSAESRDARAATLMEQIRQMRDALLAEKDQFRIIAQEAERLGSTQLSDRLERAAKVQILQ